MKKNKSIIVVVLLLLFLVLAGYKVSSLINHDLLKDVVEEDAEKLSKNAVIDLENANQHTHLPWQIKTIQQDKTINVFGLTLGNSTILEAIRLFEKTAEFGLFEDENQKLSAEVYISNIQLGLLSAKVILVADIPKETLQSIKATVIKNKSKRKATPNNRWQYSLSYDESKQVSEYPFKQLIYLSKPKYTQKQINFFGEPQSSLQLEEKQYLFYPDKSLIIEWFTNQRVVLHYLIASKYQAFRKEVQREITAE